MPAGTSVKPAATGSQVASGSQMSFIDRKYRSIARRFHIELSFITRPLRNGMLPQRPRQPPARELFERVSRYGPQTFQGQIAFSRALNEFFRDIFAALMVSAVRYPCESLFERHVHVGGSAFVEFRHPSSSLTA